MKCDWDGQYGKDEFDNLYFWCIHCGKKRGLEELRVVECNDNQSTSKSMFKSTSN